jgi:hypothetical protein
MLALFAFNFSTTSSSSGSSDGKVTNSWAVCSSTTSSNSRSGSSDGKVTGSL